MIQAQPFFSRRLVRSVVIGSFFALTLPLCAYLAFVAGPHAPGEIVWPMEIYFVAFGVTHFVITFAVYLSGANRRHFVSTPRNVLAFWVLPMLPFVFLAAWFGFAFDTQFVFATTIVGLVIRGLDFQHVSRQAFGVLQLMKGKSRAQLPAWSGRAENAHFLGLSALLLWSFANHSTLPFDSVVTWLIAAFVAVAFAATLGAYLIGFRAGADRSQLGMAFFYFAVQTTALLLAVYKLAFYACALAIHYVEYHLVMGRRVLKAPADANDTVLGALQRSPALLYLGVLMLSIFWLRLSHLQVDYIDAKTAQRTLVHLFDGLFVFHYVIEMSIWKFSDPYFRKTIAPLYG